MKFFVIDPKERTVTLTDSPSLKELQQKVIRGDVDHTTLTLASYQGHRLAMIVYEYGLVETSREQKFFSIGKNLYVGPGIVYGFDQEGETTDVVPDDMEPPFSPVFYLNIDHVELAIRNGKIDRPETSINGVPVWRWNQGPTNEGSSNTG